MLVPYRPESSEETRDKLRELTLYISQRCESDPNFGLTKLYKIILFGDVTSYLKFGESITGTAYMKQPFGPVPLHMIQVLEAMQQNNEIVIRYEPISIRHNQKRIIPIRPANVDSFRPRDIALIEDIIHECKYDNARTISDKSHGKAWELAKIGEIIPYEAFLIADDQTPNQADIEEARQMIADNGWDIYAAS